MGPIPMAVNRPGIHKAMMEIADLTIHDPSLKTQYNSRIGHAYKIALDGDSGSCETALKEIAQDMGRHLRRVRLRAYQLGALLATMIPPALYVAASQFAPLDELSIRLFLAAVLAALGGFLSVLIGSRQLELDLKESFAGTMTYGVFRIAIALISGIVVVFLIRADLILGPLKKPDNVDALAVACFVAGFSERLVPNVLKNLESGSRVRR
jgi:hypothetical protein